VGEQPRHDLITVLFVFVPLCYVWTGGFYVFVGGLAMGSAWYEIAVGIALCAMGFLYLSASCACAEHAQEEHAKTEAKIIAAEGGRPATGTGIDRYAEMEDGSSRRGRAAELDPFADRNHYSDDVVPQGARGGYGRGGDIDPFAGHVGRQNVYD